MSVVYYGLSTTTPPAVVSVSTILSKQTSGVVAYGVRQSSRAIFVSGISSYGVIPGNVKQTEVDFGATPVSEALFTITDGDVLPGTSVIGSVAYEAPTGKDLDELDMDAIDLKFGAGTGQVLIYAKGLEGYLADTFKINYLIG